MSGSMLGKDMNLYMMQKLDDESLFSLCLANKEMAEMCRNEDFWRIRFTEKYGSEAAKYKPKDRKWKQHYLKMIVDLEKLENKNPWSYFGAISWKVNISPDANKAVKYFDGETSIDVAKTDDPEYEPYHNAYWLLNLGDKVTITFPLFPGYYLDRTYVIKKEKQSNGKQEDKEKGYFSPHDILKIVYDFYQENITDEEYQLNYSRDFPVKRDKRIDYLNRDLLEFIEFVPVFSRIRIVSQRLKILRNP